MTRLDSNSIMIISKYFDTIDDFINLEIGIKKVKGNLNKFHYNPIEIDEETRNYFINLNELHFYERPCVVNDEDEEYDSEEDDEDNCK